MLFLSLVFFVIFFFIMARSKSLGFRGITEEEKLFLSFYEYRGNPLIDSGWINYKDFYSTVYSQSFNRDIILFVDIEEELSSANQSLLEVLSAMAANNPIYFIDAIKSQELVRTISSHASIRNNPEDADDSRNDEYKVQLQAPSIIVYSYGKPWCWYIRPDRDINSAKNFLIRKSQQFKEENRGGLQDVVMAYERRSYPSRYYPTFHRVFLARSYVLGAAVIFLFIALIPATREIGSAPDLSVEACAEKLRDAVGITDNPYHRGEIKKVGDKTWEIHVAYQATGHRLYGECKYRDGKLEVTDNLEVIDRD